MKEIGIPDYDEIGKRTLKELRRCVRKASNAFQQGVFSDEDVDYVFGAQVGKYYEPMPIFGERAWLRRGRQVDVVLWDEGNGWYTILAVLPHSKSLYEWAKNPI
ncbi:MAG: hypothetical protein FGF48_10185 [Candidatus Brockarchaeota archaeon]|nr:hypothetical protein [Candidatus Brockarchaeota archaeon]